MIEHSKKASKLDVNNFDSRTLYPKALENQGLSSVDNKSRSESRSKKRALVDEFENLISNAMPYKLAKLYSAGGNLSAEWYVYYYYLIPGSVDQFKRIRERFNINRQKTYQQRLSYGNELVKFLNEKLRQGFNPFTAIKVVSSQIEIKILSQLYVLKAELCETAVSQYAIASYTEVYNRTEKYITYRKIEGYLLGQFDGAEAKLFRRYLIDQKLSQKTINSTFSYLSKFLDLAFEKNWVMTNPFKALPRVKKREDKSEKDERFEPLTSGEMDLIFPYLKVEKQESFIIFLALIFYAWARPVEITRLTVADFELSRELIRFKKGKTKNGEASYVQIVPPLMRLIRKINLQQYPGHYKVFSDNFLPGVRQISKHYALKWWRKWVKDRMGIKKDMYALKHTGNIEYLLNNKENTNLKWQQMQNRHNSAAMTERYNRKLGVYFVEVGELNFRHFD